MRIKRCSNCGKYSLKETCSCGNKTLEATHKFKQYNHAKLTVQGMKDYALKKGSKTGQD